MEDLGMKKKLLVLLVALSVWLGFQAISVQAVQAEDVKVYRLYNPHLKEHLYTSDHEEAFLLFTNAGWGYEGIAWYAPKSGKPVYRLYNAQLKNHLYTTDKYEVKVLTSQHGWTVDNNGKPLFYSGGKTGIYRLYNADLNGMHLLTTDANEYRVLSSGIWSGEGKKLAAVRKGQPIKTIYQGTWDNAMPDLDFGYLIFEFNGQVYEGANVKITGIVGAADFLWKNNVGAFDAANKEIAQIVKKQPELKGRLYPYVIRRDKGWVLK
jgi:hypothetical protein